MRTGTTAWPRLGKGESARDSGAEYHQSGL